MSWKFKELAEVADLKSGGTPSKSNLDFWNGDVPWLSAKDLKSFFLRDSIDKITDSAVSNGAKMAPENSILVLVRGMTLLKDLPIGITTREVAFNQDLKAIVCDLEKVRPGFIAIFLLANRERIRAHVNLAGHGTGRLPLDALTTFPVPVPSFLEQDKITHIFNTWDKGIETLQSLIDAKTERKCGLMQQLLTGQKRLPGFSRDWAEVKIKELVNSQIRRKEPNPTLPLFSLTIENGVTPKTDRYNREALVKDKAGKKYKIVEHRDIVFNPANLRWGAIGISNEPKPVLVSPIYEVVRVKDESKIDSGFLFHLLSSPRQISIFASRVEGTLVERMAVKLGAFLLTELLIPEFTEQQAIAKILDTCDRELALHREQLEAIREQKRGLMQKLLTGEVRV